MNKLDQGDLLWGMPHLFVKEFMKITRIKKYEKGDFVFREGDKAEYFYTLIQGSVTLGIGETGQEVYIVDQVGEFFGWSSLMDRDFYSASAQCLEPTELMLIRNQQLEILLKKDPMSGAIFFRNLSQTLGNRLLRSYDIISKASRLKKYI